MKTLNITYDDATFVKINRKKRNSGLSWEKFILWAIENCNLVITDEKD